MTTSATLHAVEALAIQLGELRSGPAAARLIATAFRTARDEIELLQILKTAVADAASRRAEMKRKRWRRRSAYARGTIR
jgi:hypothetical protein